MKARKDLWAVRYRKNTDGTNTLPIYASSEQRAIEMAALFGVRTGSEIIRVEPIDTYTLSFGVVLPKTIYV